MVFGYFRQMLYLSLLFTNAVAILSEDRFLAKIGWSTRSAQTANAGFGHVQNAQLYESDSPSIKAKLVNLISAIRTLMRIPLIVFNILM